MSDPNNIFVIEDYPGEPMALPLSQEVVGRVSLLGEPGDEVGLYSPEFLGSTNVGIYGWMAEPVPPGVELTPTVDVSRQNNSDFAVVKSVIDV